MTTPASLTADSPENPFQQQGVRPWWRGLSVLLIIGVTVTEAIRLYLLPLLDVRYFSGDARQHIWWTYRLGDPELFPHDLLWRYFSQPKIMPWGLQTLYGLTTPYFDAQTVSEVIPFVLAPICVVLTYLIGKRAGGGRILGGVVALALLIFTNMLMDVGGGHARSFATPIMLLGVWAMLARHGIWLGVAFLVGVLFYPVTVVILGATAAVVMLIRLIQEHRLFKGWPVMIVLGLIALGLLIYLAGMSLPEGLGPQVTGEQARQMAAFDDGGRNAFFHDDLIRFFFWGSRPGIQAPPQEVAAMILLVAGGFYFFRKWGPMEGWVLLGVSFGLWALAHLILFKLYLPSRYMKYSGPIFEIIYLSWLATRIAPSLLVHPRAMDLVRLVSRPTLQVAAVLVVLVGLAGWGFGQARDRHADAIHGVDRPPGIEATYAYLRSLPKDTLTAAFPEDADSLPLRTRRSTLASQETSLAYHLGFYHMMAQRIRDLLAATYASDWQTVDALHEKYGVDVFVINARRFQPAHREYRPPFNEVIRAKVEQAQPAGGFVLENPPADRVLFHRGLMTVVRVGPPRRIE